MKLPSLKIGELEATLPIIQGGMGVGISRSSLAGAVAKEGGIGIISTAQIGFDEIDFETNTKEANLRSIKKHIKKAKEISNNGIIGINIMSCINNYKEQVKSAIEAGVDLIISGAGIPKDLPELVEGTKVKIAPIISSAKGAQILIKLWKKRNHVPDLIVVEGPKAGGHLGYSLEELENPRSIYDIGKEVVEKVKEFEEELNVKIPVVLAGGIFDGKDINKAFEVGASGVQIATRFVATDECDADIKYKEAYINAKMEDIEIVKSPVGMPGRAIHNKFIDRVKKEGRIAPKKCLGCITVCNPGEIPYCITKALINAVKGNIDEGLIFVGENAYKLNKIISVNELMNTLIKEAQEA